LDFLPHYRTSLSGLAGPVRFDGLRIVVDAGNGSGGFYADWLRSLGADTSGSQCLDPDGAFPNHAPNPEDPAAMASLAGAVRAARADLGVLFDADCDRAALVLSDGTPVNRDRLIYLSAAMVLAEHPGGTIVTDSVTGDHLTRAIEALGGVHHRFKRGYRNIIDEAKRLNAQGVDCPLAIETSGHAALRENHYLDDGMYLVTRLLIHAARHSLADALAHLPEPLETAELRIPIRAQDFHKEGQAALNQVETWLRASAYRIDPKNLEGIRAQTPEGDGWFLLRLSLHDPLLVWNAQSDKKDGISALWGDTAQALQGLEVTLP
jgi:phosphomannomutase